MLAQEPGEDDLAAARSLLEKHSPETIAAALARLYRSRLPAPEDVFDPGFGPDPKAGKDFAGKERTPRKERDQASGPMVWFHMDVGRRNNADPKWILPLLCRRGKITRQEIGMIKIFDRETKFEISESVAKRFADAAEVSDGDDITISPTGAPGGGDSDRKGGFGKKPFNRKGGTGPGSAKPRRPRPKPKG